mgnify:CR=1 FL=1
MLVILNECGYPLWFLLAFLGWNAQQHDAISRLLSSEDQLAKITIFGK